MAAERFAVEAGHIMMFARSIGDPNPIYYGVMASEEEGAQTIAPPTFVQASAQFNSSYGLRPKIGQPWHGSGKEASGIRREPRPASASGGASSGGGGGARGGGGGTGLHAEQHYEYHRTLKAGDVLTSSTKPGKTWEKDGRKGGKLHFSESVTEYRDQTGELVITATSVGVRTERVVEG